MESIFIKGFPIRLTGRAGILAWKLNALADQVQKVIAGFRPDVVIHCAAMSDVGQCQREPEISWARNVTGSINVACAAGQVGAKCLLCSSDQVYFAVPGNLYAKEKLAAEQEGLV